MPEDAGNRRVAPIISKRSEIIFHPNPIFFVVGTFENGTGLSFLIIELKQKESPLERNVVNKRKITSPIIEGIKFGPLKEPKILERTLTILSGIIRNAYINRVGAKISAS